MSAAPNFARLGVFCLLTLPIAAAQSSTDKQQPPPQQQQPPQSGSSSSSSSSSSQSSAPPPADTSQSQSSSQPWYSPSRYNPMKLIHRKPASDQLADNEELEQKLTDQLRTQGVLDKNANLQDKCSTFKSLQTCVAVVRASKSLKIEFACLKWDVTGVKPEEVSDAC